jgi:hypothetical protein
MPAVRGAAGIGLEVPFDERAEPQTESPTSEELGAVWSQCTDRACNGTRAIPRERPI